MVRGREFLQICDSSSNGGVHLLCNNFLEKGNFSRSGAVETAARSRAFATIYLPRYLTETGHLTLFLSSVQLLINAIAFPFTCNQRGVV
jgi:hypothetical protein